MENALQTPDVLEGPLTQAARKLQNPLGELMKSPRHSLVSWMQSPSAVRNQLGTAINGFADGGEVKETPNQLMERMSKKYGAPGSGPAQPAPEPKPEPKVEPKAEAKPAEGGIFNALNALKGRKAQIDKASGYANGGKIKGPGTKTSDSIPARVKQTGQPIAVSTDERIVSAEQDVLLQNIAKDLGFPNLDAMLEQGTGNPVGPTVKSGTVAAANGLNPNENPLPGVFRNGNAFTQNLSMSQPEATPATSGPAVGNAPAPVIAPGANPMTSALADRDLSGQTPAPLATAPVASATGVNPLTAAVGGLTTINMSANNASMARANAIRQPMIDSQAGARVDRGADSGIIKDTGLEESRALMDKWGREDAANAMVQEMGRNPKAAAAIAGVYAANQGAETNRNGQQLGAEAAMRNDATHRQGQTMAADTAARGQDVTARGQDITAQTHAAQLAGNPLTNELTKAKTAALQTSIEEKKGRAAMLAELENPETEPERRKILTDALLAAKGKGSGNGDRLTLPQIRSNFEIDAARQAVARLSPEEIKRRTAKTTNTGRDNPDFDPTLEHALTLSGRRKVGADDHFDQQQQQGAQQAPGSQGDPMARFKADPAMKGHTLGKQTESGTEVFDSTGKLIGHYR